VRSKSLLALALLLLLPQTAIATGAIPDPPLHANDFAFIGKKTRCAKPEERIEKRRIADPMLYGKGLVDHFVMVQKCDVEVVEILHAGTSGLQAGTTVKIIWRSATDLLYSPPGPERRARIAELRADTLFAQPKDWQAIWVARAPLSQPLQNPRWYPLEQQQLVLSRFPPSAP
jgi:hypothetical protein